MTLAFCRLASRSSSLWRRWKLHASATSLRQADRDGLLRRASAVLAFAYVVNLFANKFTGLRGWRFAFLCIFTSTFYGLFFRHTSSPDSKSSFLILTVDIRLGGLPWRSFVVNCFRWLCGHLSNLPQASTI